MMSNLILAVPSLIVIARWLWPLLLKLAFLDPTLVRAALHGSLPRGISRRRLIDAPMLWHQQWQEIGLSRPT